MLVVTARPAKRARFDLSAYPHVAVIDPDGREHVALELPGGLCRLDIVAGTILAGPASLRVHLKAASRIVPKLVSLDRLLRAAGVRDPLRRSPGRDVRLPRLAEALSVLDLIHTRAGQAAIAAAMLGDERASDWPGDGDHLKSWVRRRIAAARRLADAGPRAVFADRM